MNKCWCGPNGRCLEPITHNIRSPAGTLISRACEYHALQVIREYAAKLGQEWTAEPIGR